MELSPPVFGPPEPGEPALKQLHFNVSMAMELETVLANIEKTKKRQLPSFWSLPEVFRFKGEEPLALVGGGPSLADTLSDLRTFPTVMVCGSAHDYVVEQGIRPRYCVVLDPDPISADYITKPDPLCTYLVASQCDDAVFERLKNYSVAIWHCGGIGQPEQQLEWFNRENAVGGGSTVMLRALNLGIIMGYGNQHFFGMDSCLRDSEHHAYKADDSAMAHNVKRVIDVRLPGSGRTFYCLPYMAAQAEQWQDILRRQKHLFTPTVHGDGLIAEIMKLGAEKARRLDVAG